MAVILYKQGNRHKVNGIPCDFQICNEYSYLHLLDAGWKYTPEECYPKEEPELVEVPGSEEEIRTAAKDAGIKFWHNKSIERLADELKELEDAERS